MHQTRSIANRLLAFAKLYEHIAEQCWSEQQAAEFRARAGECIRQAGECEAATASGLLGRPKLGRVLEMAESSPDQETYEQKIKERFGKKEFAFMVPVPKHEEPKEAAN
jgi:hypothetical protein